MQPSENEEQRPAPDEFTVVGIGASAGGLEAFTEFLQFLPEQTGMAFVLVQHLDPHHASILAEILGTETSMPVAQVKDGTVVRPNHVYVIPPNVAMVIENRTLKLTARSTSPEQHRSIDTFFASLAVDLRVKAIGVVLSGTASDGTLGMKAIQGEGGITFAQDSSAKFDGMPRSAINAGVADFTLPPRRIAEEIAGIASHPYHHRPVEQVDLNGKEPAMQRILLLLRSRTGVDFSQYKRPTILRRLTRRMVLRRAENIDEYLAIVNNDPEELRCLFDDILINVTEYFRDPEVFESLKRDAFPEILEDLRPGSAIRVWVPGCSTGEEVYSLAIALSEFLEGEGLDLAIQIFGTDVSEPAVEKARAGIFDQTSLTNVSQDRLRRYFTKVDSGYQICRQIRELCIFSRHNVAKDPPLSRMHLISCRNLLIYLGPALQTRVISTFGYALVPCGYLVLGSSESLGIMADFFEAKVSEHKIFQRKAVVPQHAFDFTERVAVNFSRNEGPKALPPPLFTPSLGNLRKIADQSILSQFVPTSAIIDQNFRIVELRGDLSPFLTPSAHPTQNDLLLSARVELAPCLRDAVETVRNTNEVVRMDPVLIQRGEESKLVRLSVAPLHITADLHFLVLFEQFEVLPSHGDETSVGSNGLELGREVSQLKSELRSTREYLQSIIEELRSTNEEAQSANEELQSTNEELHTAKEELQSSNEELNTINIEMQSRNAELSQVNDDLLNLLSSLNMPIVMMSRDLRIRRFTPSAERVLHLIATDVGRPISDLKPRINVPNLEQILQGVLETLVVHEQEVTDQKGRWYTMRVRPYRTSDNRIDGAVLHLQDISDLKRSIEEIALARDYAQAIVDTVHAPLIVLDTDLCIRNANRAFYDYFGVSPEVVGQSIYQVTEGAFASSRIRELLTHVKSGYAPVNDVEVGVAGSAAGDRTLVLSARRFSSDGAAGSTLVAFEDITERKRTAEARYRRLFESARDGIMILDADTGDVTDVNPFVEHISGYSKQEIVGRKLWEIPFFENAASLRGAVEQIRDRGVVVFSDLAIHSRGGNDLSTEVVANIYSEADRRSIQLNIRDLTERKKFERELQHTQKLESLGLLAGGIAHDFNNLLTGIMGNASLAYTDAPPDHPVRHFTRAIINAAERASFLTRQMLAYAGKGSYVKEVMDFGGAIREISALIQTSIPRSVEVNMDLSPDLPSIEADPGQIQQLMMNLIINAAESIPEDQAGRVDIRTAVVELTEEQVRSNYAADQVLPGRYVSVEVKDTGIGIDEETRSRIFDPFFTTKFTGRGLGLAAVLGIVKSNRGAIRVYSSPGKGTTFVVLLPASTKTLRPETPKAIHAPSGSRGTVLVVDDEEMIRILAESILTRYGFRVLAAVDGQDGVNIFRARKGEIDLVLLDLLMPVMGGEEALKQLQQIDPNLPIILSSGFDQHEADRRLTNYKFTAFLQKPYPAEALVQAVTAALAHKAK